MYEKNLSRVSDGHALKKRLEMLQAQAGGDVVDARISRGWLQHGHVAKLGQRRTRAAGPRDAVPTLRRASHGQPVADHAKGKVGKEHVRPRHESEGDGRDQPQGIDHEPHAMTLVVALERAADQREYLVERHILRVRRDRRCPTPEIPQQALLGNALRDPSQNPILRGLEGAGRRSGALAAGMRIATPMLTPFGHAQQNAETMPEPPDHAGGGDRSHGGVRIDRGLAIELVAIPADRDDVDVHQH